MLQPFPFQSNLRDHFKSQNKTWQWFSEKKVQDEQRETYKTDLLKNTYRIEQNTEPKLYEILDIAKEKLGITLPVTIYQSQNIDTNNAGIVFFDDEAHIILSGATLKLLNEKELLALMGHELSHYILYKIENGDFEVTQRIITTIAADYASEIFYFETSRLFQLYTELFCDLGALKVCEDLDVCINTLVKMNTGFEKVSAESYLKQANEILDRMNEGSIGVTHPESFIRAKSLQLFQTDKETYYEEVEKIVTGKHDLLQLNLFSKQLVFDVTKSLVSIILKPNWVQSESVIALYKLYFQVYDKNPDAFIDEKIKAKIAKSKTNLKEYYAYVMLDFALCDTDLKDGFIGHILDISEQLELDEELKTILKKELKLTEKPFKAYCQLCTTTLNNILESAQENTY
jgi:hypothetical protein